MAREELVQCLPCALETYVKGTASIHLFEVVLRWLKNIRDGDDHGDTSRYVIDWVGLQAVHTTKKIGNGIVLTFMWHIMKE